MKREAITHTFVEFIPDQLDEGTLYVSIPFATAVHRCFCGCGREVVTPLSPTDWKMTFDGKTVSLDPSVGSWNIPCKSHYWIRQNKIVWAGRWTDNEITGARVQERRLKDEYFMAQNDAAPAESGTSRERRPSLARRIRRWIVGR